MKEILLECGSIVLVDDEDYAYVTECYDLYIDKNGYVQCRIKEKFRYKKMGLWPSLSLHKLLINPDKLGRKITVDHINGNKLDNRKSNLRVCLHMENMRNRKLQDGTSSKYKGVAWKKKNKVWEVRIRDGNGGNKYLGCFTDEIAAANCYNYHALIDFGEFALLNDVPYMPVEEWQKYKTGHYKTSKYRGVSLINGKYVAQIWDNVNKRNIRIGEYDSEEDAALAWNEMAIKLRGNNAKLNII